MLKWRRSNVVDQSFSQLKKSETYSFLSLVVNQLLFTLLVFKMYLLIYMTPHMFCFENRNCKWYYDFGVIIFIYVFKLIYYLLRSLSNWTDIYTKVNCKQTMDGTYLLLLLMSLGHFSSSLEMEKLCDEKCTSFCIIYNLPGRHKSTFVAAICLHKFKKM